jgi:AmmeMemoRadiSam system protein A
LLLALPYPGSGSESLMGRAIAAAADQLGERWAVLASGDMSHRLIPGAPAGHHPEAASFDRGYVGLIAAGELERAAGFDARLRELAAEDVVDSVAVASGAVDFDARGHELLSYEGPFGVGYMEAVLHDAFAVEHASACAPLDAEPPEVLLSIARQAIDAGLRARDYEPPSLPPPWNRSRGVFVTLRTAEGELRGCIGHLEPVCPDLAHELASCALSAATRDSRFEPVALSELPGLRLEVSVLSPPEPATARDLDPARFGVVVSGHGRRGVLLPEVDGVESVAEQLAIATRKAGLRAEQVESLERFRVEKLEERGDTASHGTR